MMMIKNISVRDEFRKFRSGGLKSLARIFSSIRLAWKSSGFARILPDFLPKNGYLKNSRGGGGLPAAQFSPVGSAPPPPPPPAERLFQGWRRAQRECEKPGGGGGALNYTAAVHMRDHRFFEPTLSKFIHWSNLYPIQVFSRAFLTSITPKTYP